MDAVISIGSQSLLDGLLRMVGPALQALRGPLPIAIPGLTGAAIRIRNMEPVLPGSMRGHVELRVDLEVTGEVLLTASVAAGTVNLSLGTGTVNLGAGTGSVTLPTGTAPLSLGALAGTISLPDGVGDLALPLPAVVPVAVDLTRGTAISAQVFLAVDANGAAVGAEAAIDATTGFSVELGLDAARVVVSPIPAAFATDLQAQLTNGVDALVAQLMRGLDPALVAGIVQPTRDLARVATDIAGAVPAVLTSALTDAFTGLLARTGRLVYPAPGAGASCEMRALPTAAKARLTVATDGSLALQLGVNRTAIAATDTFPPFSPSSGLDTTVSVSNAFLRDLICCMLEGLPNLALPAAGPTMRATATESCCRWTGVTVNLGVISMRGTMDLCITGGAGSPKTLSLDFDLAQTIDAPVPILGAIQALVMRLRFNIPIAVDLSNLAAITSLRTSAAPTVREFTVRLGTGLQIGLIGAAASIWLPAGGLQAVIGFLPPVVVEIARQILANAVDNVLMGVRAIQSPPALPPAIFDAFGKLVPASLTIDDLDVHGVLDTPTSAWSVLPLLREKRRRPPKDRPPVGPVTHVPARRGTTSTTSTTKNQEREEEVPG